LVGTGHAFCAALRVACLGSGICEGCGLCHRFTMGLQNAIITKLSNSVIRTTHVTGMVTYPGIALGRIVYAVFERTACNIAAELATLRLLASLIALFFIGGVTGALGFKHVGFFFTIPLSIMLMLLAVMPVIDDVRGRRPAAVHEG
jgi:uncharacterized membrane protein YoaK (UPF0700 family)